MSRHDSDTSQTLLEQLGEQDNAASWKQLLDLYSPLLHSWLARYDVQASDADDLVQDVIMMPVQDQLRRNTSCLFTTGHE